MTTLRDTLEVALRDANVQAFLRVIRQGETSQDNAAYQTLYGGGQFDDLSKHPNRKITAGKWTSTAAGAYQFLSGTWAEVKAAVGLPDFSPRSQDIGAVFLIRRRKALEDVLAGRIEQAIRKCNREWASLPESPYGQPVRTMAQALSTYAQWGGKLSASEPTNLPAAPAQPEQPMAPFILAALPALIEAVPKLGALFSSGSEVAERNVKAAEVVVQAAKEAIGARNEQELVETLKQGDPDTIRAVQAAVQSVWYEIAVDNSGVQGARESSQNTHDFWKQPAFWVTVLLTPLVYITLYAVLFREGFTAEIKAMVVAAVVSGLLGAFTGFWLGSSFSSQRKTELTQR